MLLPVTALKTRAIAAVTALSLAASLPAAPALAWGEKEQNFLAGVATAVVVGTIINDIKHKERARRLQPVPVYRGQPAPPPVYAPAPVYAPGHVSIYATPAARAFQSYSPAERKAIQRRLATQGYYRSGIDGSFGPGTYSAVLAYARDSRMDANLQSTSGAYAVYDGLLF